ncbi:hypothetical protein A3K29_04425 [Candidatus Collierbacteria bacterium RIFOXYB2_FULL_46_14]|nr:MAG: hypothetical protein A3K29_04425 [Candidatus Collierbacteria bacterium RIFOXYB2_FULL_46_14]OGD76387.1 MAG: hypothetical protein A3K43_04425 [Candidatus Collierbacteria bacterium RIFOXYA2_FULL_46_20]OGD77723.1 MAG: hypothetical protein A3K39_04425 [Candidatus Collierbacteria bacterium RIFOXYC2_FULL_43_15]OGD81013.1 MAG: hypothetical protein A2320_04920 [Pseudomonadales bacterium GWC2_63_15]OGD82445.1 MAG: hypothetical protein A3K36_04425 [Candidatus Collierbacteria bacterium RIFOXYD2_FUL
MEVTLTNIVLWIVVAGFVWIEWNHRAKKDGKREATKAMLFAGCVFLVGVVAMHYGGVVGLLILSSFLLLTLIGLFIYRNRQFRSNTPE